MHKYDRMKNLADDEFRRLTGVKPPTFEAMVLILKEAELKKNRLGGKPNRLNIENRLLIAGIYNYEVAYIT